MEDTNYEKLIHDAEWRIGSYISTGGNSKDEYVKKQISKIRDWSERLARSTKCAKCGGDLLQENGGEVFCSEGRDSF